MTVTGKLLGAGRTADVYAIDEGWVLRRDRRGWGDAAAEADVMAYAGRCGYPVPEVRASGAAAGDLVMRRLYGATLRVFWTRCSPGLRGSPKRGSPRLCGGGPGIRP